MSIVFIILVLSFLLVPLGIYFRFPKITTTNICSNCRFSSDDGEVCFNTLGWEPTPLRGYCNNFEVDDE